MQQAANEIVRCCVEPSKSRCRATFEAYREQRDRMLRNRLIEEHEWLADRGAQTFAARGQALDDLKQVGYIGLIKAVERFDPERGSAFAAFATPTINGEIKRYFRDRTWGVSVPRYAKDQRPAVAQAVDVLHQRLGRSPNADEVANHLGLDRDIVIQTLTANQAYRPASLDKLMHTRSPAELSTASASDTPTEDRVAVAAAIRMLDNRSRQILYWRFFDDCTQSEIGGRLGIGQVQVSRLLTAALAELKGRLADAA